MATLKEDLEAEVWKLFPDVSIIQQTFINSILVTIRKVPDTVVLEVIKGVKEKIDCLISKHETKKQ